MPELSDEERKAILETHDAVIRLVTLIGDGDEGLCAEVKKQGEALFALNEKHEKLNGHFLLLVGLLGGSGVLGGSVAGIIQLLK